MISKIQDKNHAFMEIDCYDYSIECDSCSFEEIKENVYVWQDMIEELKEKGWKIYYNGSEWIHLCPDCV